MNIWIPKTRILEPSQELELPSCRAAGMFRIEGIMPDGRRRVLADWQHNLITDAGLERMGTATPISYCSVGSGNTTPSVLDTALVTYVAHTAVTVTSYGVKASEPWCGYAVFTCTFSPPGSNKNISEIGLGWATGGGSLWSRALTKDAWGSPTTITWLAAETLIVTYECRNYPWLTDIPFETTISGITYTGVMRVSNVINASHWGYYNAAHQIIYRPDTTASPPGLFSGSIGAITSGPGGSGTYGTWINVPAYVPYSYKRTGTGSWGPAIANYGGGITSARIIPTNGAYQMSFSPAIMKTSSDTLTLTFSTPVWGRYS